MSMHAWPANSSNQKIKYVSQGAFCLLLIISSKSKPFQRTHPAPIRTAVGEIYSLAQEGYTAYTGWIDAHVYQSKFRLFLPDFLLIYIETYSNSIEC